MADFVQIGVGPAKAAAPRTAVLWLQGITLAWMLVEFGVAAYAAATAHSPALLAFGSDSLVELLSAASQAEARSGQARAFFQLAYASP